MLWPGGNHRYYEVDCGRWDCVFCQAKKLTDLAFHLAGSIGKEDTVWSGVVGARWAKASLKAARRVDANYVSLTLCTEGLWVVCSDPLKGRGWGLEESALKALVLTLGAWPHAQPKYTSWRGWSPGRKEKEKALFTARFYDMPSMKRWAKRAGFQLNGPPVDDPDAVALRLEAAREEPPVVHHKGKLRVTAHGISPA